MAKRRKPRAPKKGKGNLSEPKSDESPSPAKKMAAVSSTSQLDEAHVSSCTSLPADLGAESPSKASVSPSGFPCTCCSFSADSRSVLDDHMEQHKLKCLWCPFSSLSHLEVIHHCKFAHDKKSTEMDTIPCLACVCCDFVTYIQEHLEKHIALRHPDKPFRSVSKIISKEVSACVRQDDTNFAQTLSNDTSRSQFMKIEPGTQSGAKSNPIIIDGVSEVSERIKCEAASGSGSKECEKTTDPTTDSINRQLLINYLLTDIAASKLKAESGALETSEARGAADMEVKLERIYCLTCPYSSISIDEVKCHTLVQHPVGAAAATYNEKGESTSMEDATFFCVRQSCSYSSFDYSSYQRHLVDCCASQKSLCVLERERLKTTVMYMLDCQRKYSLRLDNMFLNLVLVCCGNPSQANMAPASASSNLGSQTSLPLNTKNVNKSSLVYQGHSSPPETSLTHAPSHSQPTSSAGSTSCAQHDNIQTPYSACLESAQRCQTSSQEVSNVHTTGPVLTSTADKYVSILDTFSLSQSPSVLPVNSTSNPSAVPVNSSSVSVNPPVKMSSLPSDVLYSSYVPSPLNSSNPPLNVLFHSSNAANVSANVISQQSNVLFHPSNALNVPVNSSNQPSNVLVNPNNRPSHVSAALDIPIGSSSEASFVPDSRSILQPHQFPVNNSNFLFDQSGNEKQQPAAFSVDSINQNTAANVHNFLLGANTASFTNQPSALINSRQCYRMTGNLSQNSSASNPAACINPGALNLRHSIQSNLSPVSQAGQQQPGIPVNSGQSYFVTNWQHQNSLAGQNQDNYTSTNGPGNIVADMRQMKLAGGYHNLPVSQSYMIGERVASEVQFGVSTMAATINQATSGSIRQISPASQLDTTRGSTVFGQDSCNPMIAGVNLGTANNINNTFSTSQCNTVEDRTVFGHQSGSSMTEDNSHNSSLYNTVAGRATSAQNGQSGILTSTGFQKGPPGNPTFTAPANQAGASFRYEQQPGNLTLPSFKHNIADNKNEALSHTVDPSVTQETCQMQQHNVTLTENSPQQNPLDSNKILVFDLSRSNSRLRELTYSNQSQLAPSDFYQAASLSTQDQMAVGPVHFAGQSGMNGSQTISGGTPGLHSTVRRNSAEHNSASQFSGSSVSQNSHFTGKNENVNSYSGLQGAKYTENNRTVCSTLPENVSNTQVIQNVSNTSPFERGSSRPSHVNQGARSLRSVSVHRGSRMAASPQQGHLAHPVMTTSPRQGNPLRPVIISSIPPSMSHQNPARGRTFTGARIAALTGACPRRSAGSVTPQSRRGKVTHQRQISRGQGQAKSPRIMPGRTTVSHNNVNCDDSDDDIIMTSGFSPEDQQKPPGRSSGLRLPVAQPQWMSPANSRQNSQTSKVHPAKAVIDVTPVDEVEIISDVAGETGSGITRGSGFEVSGKAGPVGSWSTPRRQNNSVRWDEKGNFGSGLSDVYCDIVSSSVRFTPKPSTSHSSVRPTAPSRGEVVQGSISANQQHLIRPPVYSEHIDLVSRMITVHYPPPKSTQIRASLRQISPAGLSPSVSSYKQMQQTPPPVHLQKITPSRASASNITPSLSSKPPAHSEHQPAVVVDADGPPPSKQTNRNTYVVDAEGPPPSKQTNRNTYVSQESHQDVMVIESDISTEFRQSRKIQNRDPAQDVIILDADPSKHLQQTDTNSSKTAETPECFIIHDGDTSEKFVDKERTPFVAAEQAVSKRKVSRPSFPVPNTGGKKTVLPQAAGHNLNKTNIYKPRAQQSLTPAPQGSSVNSRASPIHQTFARPSSSSPAPRSTVRTPRAPSISPVSIGHLNNYPDSTVTARGPSPAYRGPNAQNRNGARTGTNRPASEVGNHSPMSASPVSIGHLNNYPDSTVTARGPSPAYRGTNAQNKNGPRTGTNKPASEVGNHSPMPAASASPVSLSHSNHYSDSAVAQQRPLSAARVTSAQNRNGQQIAPCLNHSSAASVSPVSINHQNHYTGSILTQTGPQPVLGGTNVQNRSGPHISRGLNSSSVASIPSVRFPNHYSDSASTQRGPQCASRSTYYPDTNGPETVTNTLVASAVNNPSTVSTNVVSNLSTVPGVTGSSSEGTSGYTEKTGTPEMPRKEAPTTGVPCLPDKPQPATHSAGKENHAELSSNKSNQPKVPENLPALLLAQFKKCASLKTLKSVAQKSAVTSTTAGTCSQRNFSNGIASVANPNTDVSSHPSGVSGKAGEVLGVPPSFQSPLKLPDCFSVTEDGEEHDITQLTASSTTRSEVDSEKIFIYDLDVDEKQATLPSSSDDMLIFYCGVKEQRLESVLAVQIPQNRMADASSGTRITRSASVAPAININLLNSVSEPRKSTSAEVLRAHPTDVNSPHPTDVNSPHPTDVNSPQSGHARSVEAVKQNSPLLYMQVKDPPVLHNQLKDSPGAHNQLKDPPVLHNQLKDPLALHNQFKDSVGLQNQLRDSPNPKITNHPEDSLAALLPPGVVSQVVESQVTNKTEASPSSNPKELQADSQTPTSGPADSSSKVVTRGRGRSKKVVKKQGVDESRNVSSEETKKEICQNESESKELAVEKKVVRHSDRLQKTVLKDFTISAYDSDVPLSDGSEFHLEDEDLDTDSEWSDGTEKNKTKSKRPDMPSDPTAFKTSLKGHFKCWLCQKIYNRCTAAKDHIVKKHAAGLCVIDIDRSKEVDSVCLLMFCPRTCVYATNTLAALNNHMQTCSNPFLMERNDYPEINRAFLDEKYTELVNTPLETLLCSATRRKPKDPAKAQKAKKPRPSLAAEQISRPSHTMVAFPNSSGASSAPVTPLNHRVPDGKFGPGAFQNTSSFQAHNMQPQQQNQGQEHVGPGPARSSQVSHQQRSNHCAVNRSLQSLQLPVTLNSWAAASKDTTPSNPNLQNTHQRSLPSLQSPEQRLITSSEPAPSGVSTPHHLVHSSRMGGQSAELEDVVVVDGCEIICLE